MKTSKYILIAFLIFIFGGLLSLYIFSKLHKEKHLEFTKVEEKLNNFSVIVAEEGAGFYLVPDSVFKIGASLFENDSSFHFPVYIVENDTLYIQALNYKYSRLKINCNSVNTIIGKSKNRIDFNHFAADSLMIEINNGEMYGSFSEKGVKNLRIKATDNSNINFNNSKIENIELTLYQSRASLYNNDVKTLDAKLFNKSNLFGMVVSKLYLQTDSTSNYRVGY
ncbi:MAG: hypothetical protein ABFS35_20240 [Bacteroidota bacterium]